MAGLAARHTGPDLRVLARFVFACPIGLGNPGPRHRDGSGRAAVDHGFDFFGRADTVGDNDRDIERFGKRARRFSERRARLRHGWDRVGRGPVRPRHQRDVIEQPVLLECRNRLERGRRIVVFVCARHMVCDRGANADRKVGTRGVAHGFQNRAHDTQAVIERPAIVVGAPIEHRRQKRAQQIVGRGLHFENIDARLTAPRRRGTIGLDKFFDFHDAECLGHLPHRIRHRRGADRGAAGQPGDVVPTMPQRNRELGACGVDRIGGGGEAGQKIVAGDADLEAGKGLAGRMDRERRGTDQRGAAFRPCRDIGLVAWADRAAVVAQAHSVGRHGGAVFQCHRAESEGAEERGVVRVWRHVRSLGRDSAS